MYFFSISYILIYIHFANYEQKVLIFYLLSSYMSFQNTIQQQSKHQSNPYYQQYQSNLPDQNYPKTCSVIYDSPINNIDQNEALIKTLQFYETILLSIDDYSAFNKNVIVSPQLKNLPKQIRSKIFSQSYILKNSKNKSKISDQKDINYQNQSLSVTNFSSKSKILENQSLSSSINSTSSVYDQNIEVFNKMMTVGQLKELFQKLTTKYKRLSDELKSLKLQHEQQISTLEAQKSQEINEKEMQLIKEMKQLVKSHQNQLEYLQHKLKQKQDEIKRLNEQITSMSSQLEDKENQIIDVRNELQEKVNLLQKRSPNFRSFNASKQQPRVSLSKTQMSAKIEKQTKFNEESKSSTQNGEQIADLKKEIWMLRVTLQTKEKVINQTNKKINKMKQTMNELFS